MLQWLKARSVLRRKAGEIYGAIVTQARLPVFYAGLGIPDTPVGRYEAVVIHLFLVLERLRMAGPEAIKLSRVLIETFIADMDDYVRQYGASDVGTAKKVRRAAAGFYERAAQYREAMAERRLGQVLDEHVLGAATSNPATAALARHMEDVAAALANQGDAALLAGKVEFPVSPATVGKP
jgi:cytochrome b pre-mRNA-processing protein 3